MTKWKTTISIDRGKVEEAKRLTGAASVSATVDLALDRLLRAERLRRDLAAYEATPPTDAELALAAIPPRWDVLADETDWEELYREAGDGDLAQVRGRGTVETSERKRGSRR